MASIDEPYSMTMPGGEIVTDIPPDVSPREAIRRWKTDWVERNYTETPRTDVSMQDIEKVRGEEYGGFEKFRAGVGQGMTNIARNIGNITGFVTDEEMERHKEQDAPLTSTGAGMAGSLVGETAALAPLGAISAGGKAVAAANTARPILQGLSKSRTAALGAEGAAGGAIAVGPNERLSGAATGAATGAGFGAVAGTGRVLSEGIIPTSPKAAQLQREIGENLPLKAAADDTTTMGEISKFVYGEALPFFPGTSSLNKQMQKADEDIMRTAVKMSTPEGVTAKDIVELESAFVKGYDGSVGKYSLTNLEDIGWSGLPEASVTAINNKIKKYVVDETVKGKDIPRVRATLAEWVDTTGTPGSDTVMSQFDDYVIDQMVRSKAKPAITNVEKAENQAAIEIYRGLNAKYDNFRRLADAAAKSGGLRVPTLADSARKMSPVGDKVSRTGPMQEFSERAADVMGSKLPNPSLWGRIASMNSVALTAAKGVLFAATGGLAYIGGKGLSSQAAQNTLLGRTGLQKAAQAAKSIIPDSAISAASQSRVQQKLEEEGL